MCVVLFDKYVKFPETFYIFQADLGNGSEIFRKTKEYIYLPLGHLREYEVSHKKMFLK